MGWAMSRTLGTKLAMDALSMRSRTGSTGNAALDQITYATGSYRNVALWHPAEHESQGDCWDNAPMESFFHTLKTELAHCDYKTRDDARSACSTTWKWV